MEPTFVPRLRDDDFESPPGTIPRDLGADAGSYLRIVANPFLGFFGIIALIGVLGPLQQYQGLDRFGAILIFSLAAVLGLPKLLQFHCLDCRETGRLSRWRRHICAESAARRREARPRRFRGPSPMVQVVLWLVPTLLVVIVIHAASLPFR